MSATACRQAGSAVFLAAGASDAAFPSRRLCGITTAAAFDLHVHLTSAPRAALIYAADLTEAYVDFNKGDVNDPATAWRLNWAAIRLVGAF